MVPVTFLLSMTFLTWIAASVSVRALSICPVIVARVVALVVSLGSPAICALAPVCWAWGMINGFRVGVAASARSASLTRCSRDGRARVRSWGGSRFRCRAWVGVTRFWEEQGSHPGGAPCSFCVGFAGIILARQKAIGRNPGRFRPVRRSLSLPGVLGVQQLHNTTISPSVNPFGLSPEQLAACFATDDLRREHLGAASPLPTGDDSARLLAPAAVSQAERLGLAVVPAAVVQRVGHAPRSSNTGAQRTGAGAVVAAGSVLPVLAVADASPSAPSVWDENNALEAASWGCPAGGFLIDWLRFCGGGSRCAGFALEVVA